MSEATQATGALPDASEAALIVRSESPLNLEMPFSQLNDFVTPNELFYVRCHFPVPTIAETDWRVRIEGAIENPLELDYRQLRQLEWRTTPATLECAGNNRIFLEPKVKGVQWGLGAVGNAVWSGVPLSTVLERAGVNSQAREVILEGADTGQVEPTPRPPGPITFARSIPLDKAMDDVLLAFEMNGQPLSPSHGFPVRAIVPGYYAMASVKWLRRIVVTEKPFAGFYQSTDYSYWERGSGLPSLTALSLQQVKAQIAQPAPGQNVSRSSRVRVHGAAWTGAGTVETVDVSTDSGATWNEARLLQTEHKRAWRLWEFDWQTPSQPGTVTLIARATDSEGRTQPAERDQDRGTYMINHVLPTQVQVR